VGFDSQLRAVRVAASVRHAQSASLRMLVSALDFVLERLSPNRLAALSRPRWVSALDLNIELESQCLNIF
jgi:hypothetical protein